MKEKVRKMLKIRLARFGRKKQPRFKIVVCEDSQPLKGKFLQILGSFNPQTGDISINSEKVLNFLEKGAMPSNAVSKILKKEGLKHKAIVIKVFKAKSQKELEEEKRREEEEKARRKAELEKAKQEWEEKSAQVAEATAKAEIEAAPAESAPEKAEATGPASGSERRPPARRAKTEEKVKSEENKSESKDIPSS